MLDPKCKKCRRAGEKLFLKGERCFSPKCAMVRKPYVPGMHGKKRRRRVSEYGTQLREKQKLKILYGLREKQFSRYISEAVEQKVNSGRKLFEFLEARLDNAVFRGGLATSRSVARQMVGHGHILVNGRKMDIPSYRVKKDDVIGIRPSSMEKGMFKNLDMYLNKYEAPEWISLDKKKKEIKILNNPVIDQEKTGFDASYIIEFYSR